MFQNSDTHIKWENGENAVGAFNKAKTTDKQMDNLWVMVFLSFLFLQVKKEAHFWDQPDVEKKSFEFSSKKKSTWQKATPRNRHQEVCIMNC